MESSSHFHSFVNVTTNKALVLSSNNSRNSPTTDQHDDSRPFFSQTLLIERREASDLVKTNLNSIEEQASFLTFVRADRSLSFSKNENILNDEEYEEKFKIKIVMKDDCNLRISSLQLLSSETMFELHSGDTNEYISTVNCDFIDELDQQYVIYYGSHNFISDTNNTSSKIRSEMLLKKSLTISFPKFNSSCKDTIWIYGIKLNLIECRMLIGDRSNSMTDNTQSMNNVLNSLNGFLPLISMFKQIKNDSKSQIALFNGTKSDTQSSTSPLSNVNSRNSFDQATSSSNYSLPHSLSDLTQLLPNLKISDNSALLSTNNERNSIEEHIESCSRTRQQYSFASRSKYMRRKGVHRSQITMNRLILKKLNDLEFKMNSLDQKLAHYFDLQTANVDKNFDKHKFL